MTVTAHYAMCLPNVQLFGAQDPYVVVKTLPSQTSIGRTKCHNNGGTNPVWESELLLYPNEYDDNVQIEVWNDNVVIDSIIGEASIMLRELKLGKRRLGLQLSDGGVIECSFDLARNSVLPEAHATKTRARRTTVKAKRVAVVEHDALCQNPMLSIEVGCRKSDSDTVAYATLTMFGFC